MSNEKRNVPELRFPEFEDEWEEYFLEDKSDLITKGTTPKEWKNDGEVNFIKVENIDQDSGKVKISSKISYLEHVKHLRRSILEEGDILFSIAGTLGRITIIDKEILPANTNQALAIIRNQSINKYYLKTYLLGKSIKEYIRKNPTIGAQPNLSLKQIKSFKIKLPESEEQEKIGDFFSILDKQIELEEKKLELLEQQKKGYMQKIFSQELRFKDEKDNAYPNWITKKLGDIGKVAMNKRIYKNETTPKGEVPFYKIGNFGKKAETFITREKFNEYKEKYPYPKIGDILISASGSIGRTIEYKGEDAYYQDSNIVWLDHNAEVLNIFLKYYYKIIKWAGVEGTTIKRLYNKNILNTKIELPTIEEQQQIGRFLTEIDKLIEKQFSKIELLKERKQVFLQKMFI